MAKHHVLLRSKVPPLQNDIEKGDQFVVWDMSEGDTDGSIPSGIRFDSQLSDYGIGFDLDVASRFTQIPPILWPGFYNIFLVTVETSMAFTRFGVYFILYVCTQYIFQYSMFGTVSDIIR